MFNLKKIAKVLGTSTTSDNEMAISLNIAYTVADIIYMIVLLVSVFDSNAKQYIKHCLIFLLGIKFLLIGISFRSEMILNNSEKNNSEKKKDCCLKTELLI